MSVSGRKVDHEQRVDEVLHFVEDKVAYNIVYYGRTEGFDTADTDSLWQIKRITISGDEKRTLYANFGKYNCRWDLRTTYFPAEPAPIADPTVTFTPSGLRNGGRITEVTLSDVAWTVLPATALASRNAMSIQNVSGSEIKVNYDFTAPLPAGYVGTVIPSGGERQYDITDAIPLYAKAETGSPIIIVEEIS